MRTVDLKALLILLSVSAVLAYGYFRQVDQPNFKVRLELHEQIVHGTAPSPYRYRVLVPLTCEALRRLSAHILSSRRAFLVSYGLYDFLAIFFLLAALFQYSTVWFTREQSLVGTLFVAGTMSIALRDHLFQPWSVLEAALFAAALLSIYQKRYGLLGILIALATLNRETAFFLPLLFLATSHDCASMSERGQGFRWKQVGLFVGYLLIWGAVFCGLRIFLGSASHVESIGGLLSQNIRPASLCLAAVHATLFLGAFWVLGVLGLRKSPPFLRRATCIIPFYLLTVVTWGVWREVRLLMPLYPIVVPLGLTAIFPDTKGVSDPV